LRAGERALVDGQPRGRVGPDGGVRRGRRALLDPAGVTAHVDGEHLPVDPKLPPRHQAVRSLGAETLGQREHAFPDDARLGAGPVQCPSLPEDEIYRESNRTGRLPRPLLAPSLGPSRNPPPYVLLAEPRA